MKAYFHSLIVINIGVVIRSSEEGGEGHGDEKQAKWKGWIVVELALSLMVSSALQTLSQRLGSIVYRLPATE